MLLDEDDVLRAVGSTDRSAAILEEAQAELRQRAGGRMYEPARRALRSPTWRADPAYADLWARVQHTRIRAVLSAAVRVRGIVTGNLNAVMYRPHDWTADEIFASEAYANVVAVTLDLAGRTADAAHQLNRLRSRWRLVRMSDATGTGSSALE